MTFKIGDYGFIIILMIILGMCNLYEDWKNGELPIGNKIEQGIENGESRSVKKKSK